MNFEKPSVNPNEESKAQSKLRQGVSREEIFDRAAREKQRVPEELLELKRESLETGNLSMDIIGVMHMPETIARFRSEIEEAIKNSDFIITEAVLNVGSAKKEDVLDTAEATKMGLGPLAFFGEIEAMARKYGKQIVTMDPQSSGKDMEEGRFFNHDLLKAGPELQKTHEKIGGAGMLAVGGLVAADILKQGRTSENRNENTSRRAVLKGMAYGAAVLATADGIINSTDRAYYRGDHKMTLHSTQDYRDVVVAGGMEKLGESFKRKMKAAVIYGWAHDAGLMYYLENPVQRALKRKTYSGFDDVAKPELRAYKFDDDEKHWVEVTRSKI